MTARLAPCGVIVDLATADPDQTGAAYRRLLDRPDPAPLAVINGAVELHPDAATHRVRFGVADLPAARRLLDRRGLSPDEPVDITDASDIGTSDARRSPGGEPARDIVALDHLVFSAPHRDRALALFGATLDLDFRLDRAIGGAARQLFFRSADLVVEVITGADLDGTDAAPVCGLWGVAWRSSDIDATHRRLTTAGFDVSEVRVGRKPGTQIFTVRDDALATRTVVLSAADRTGRP
ncbi:VOC family protein [Gordonia sp. NPDC003424]